MTPIMGNLVVHNVQRECFGTDKFVLVKILILKYNIMVIAYKRVILNNKYIYYYYNH